MEQCGGGGRRRVGGGGGGEKAVEEDGSAESCQAEMTNIAEMRSWMKENGKDYYSIYFLNGTSYEMVD